MMLNYDLTFLAILLTGLYEPETKVEERRCLIHPLRRHRSSENEAISYAADMSVLLAYQKLRDDWRDERRPGSRPLASLLKRDYRGLLQKYPRQGAAIEENIARLSEAERENQKDIDDVAGLTGRFLAEIFVWKEDEWQEELRTVGFYLGKFIYLMDALEDLPKDKKKRNYNLFSEEEVWSGTAEPVIREMLTAMAAEAARAFERLPILENVEILRNILYSGIWTRYVQIREEGRKTAGTDSVPGGVGTKQREDLPEER